jgi:hypothetical protein
MPENCQFWLFAKILLTANRLKHVVQGKSDGKMTFSIAAYHTLPLVAPQ